MWFILFDYIILGLLFTGVFIYKDRDYIKKLDDIEKFKAFMITFFMWWALLFYELVLYFIRFIVKL